MNNNEGFDSLRDLSENIQKEGLPSKEAMQDQLESKREADFAKITHRKLERYKELFSRWKKEELNDEETKEMSSLNDELQSIVKDLN